MTISQAKAKIEEYKKQKDICILAHSYESRDIIEIADFTGDSYKLSVDASKVKNKNIVFAGVHFMAQTAKMLSPGKNVYMPNTAAGCEMAEQMDVDTLAAMKKKEPDRLVVAYVNTTAELKTLCDVCVTSSSAVKIVSALKEKKILFIPDCNLGDFVKKACPDKDIMLFNGGCPAHQRASKADAIAAKAAHPEALLLVHPECRPEVTALADYVGSTSGIMQFAHKSDKKEFIIGTEMSIAEHLEFECPDKKFFLLSKNIICPNMRMTTLMDVYSICKDIDTPAASDREIIMSDELIRKARVCIDKMIELGG